MASEGEMKECEAIVDELTKPMRERLETTVIDEILIGDAALDKELCQKSVSIGPYANINATDSMWECIAFGFRAQTSGRRCIAIGIDAQAHGDESMAIGHGVVARNGERIIKVDDWFRFLHELRESLCSNG